MFTFSLPMVFLFLLMLHAIISFCFYHKLPPCGSFVEKYVKPLETVSQLSYLPALFVFVIIFVNMFINNHLHITNFHLVLITCLIFLVLQLSKKGSILGNNSGDKFIKPLKTIYLLLHLPAIFVIGISFMDNHRHVLILYLALMVAFLITCIILLILYRRSNGSINRTLTICIWSSLKVLLICGVLFTMGSNYFGNTLSDTNYLGHTVSIQGFSSTTVSIENVGLKWSLTTPYGSSTQFVEVGSSVYNTARSFFTHILTMRGIAFRFVSLGGFIIAYLILACFIKMDGDNLLIYSNKVSTGIVIGFYIASLVPVFLFYYFYSAAAADAYLAFIAFIEAGL